MSLCPHWSVLSAVQTSCRINIMCKLCNGVDNHATDLQCWSFDGGQNGESDCIGFVNISFTFATDSGFLNMMIVVGTLGIINYRWVGSYHQLCASKMCELSVTELKELQKHCLSVETYSLVCRSLGGVSCNRHLTHVMHNWWCHTMRYTGNDMSMWQPWPHSSHSIN